MGLSSLLGIKTDICGLDVGKHAVRVAQLKYAGQHAPLHGVGAADLPKKAFDKELIADPENFKEVLRSALANAQPGRITARAVVAALPETYIFTRVIQLPNLPPQDLQRAIKYEASQYLPVPIEEVYFDYTPLSVHQDKQQIDAALFAAPKSLVDQLTNVIHDCGLELYALETKATAITRSLLPNDSNETVCVIEIGSESTRMTVVDHGNVWLTTSLNIGYLQVIKALSEKISKPESEVEAFLASHQSKATEDIIKTVVTPIVQEMASVIRYHETRDKQSQPVRRALIVGQGAMIPGLIPSIVSSTHFACEAGLPLVATKETINLSFSVALGLSMRRV